MAGHGGARPGSGRKTAVGGGGEKRKTFSFSLRPSLITALDEIARAGNLTRSQALEKLIEQTMGK